MRALYRSLLAVALLSSAHVVQAQQRVVHVYNWSDYITDDAIAEFQKQSGIKVVYDVYDSNEILSSKLLAGKSGYDVIFPSARPFAANHIRAKLYAPLNKALLPNFKSLDPAMMASFRDFDPQNDYIVPYMWSVTGLGINVKKVQAMLGSTAKLDTWTLLFDPATTAKLKGCGIAVLDDETETLGAALIYLGKPAKSGLKADLDAVAKLYGAVRKDVRYFNSSRYIDDLANGDICLALGYSGDILQARDRAVEAKNGQDIRFLIPSEGAIRNMDVIAVPKDAGHIPEAHAFINFLLDPKVIAGISNEIRYPNGNKDSTPLLAADIRNDPGIYPPPATLAKMIDDVAPSATDQRARNRAWTKIKSGK